MYGVIKHTLEQEIPLEAAAIADHRAARLRLKGLVDLPNPMVDRIISSIKEMGGRVTNKLRKEFDFLQDEEFAEEIVRAVHQPEPDEDSVSDSRE